MKSVLKLKGAEPHNGDFALSMLSPGGQQILADMALRRGALSAPDR
jgi:hypothetical protein